MMEFEALKIRKTGKKKWKTQLSFFEVSQILCDFFE